MSEPTVRPIIGEGTLVPLSAISAVVALAFWVGSLATHVQTSTLAVTLVEREQHAHEMRDNDTASRVAVLESKINFIYDYVREQRGQVTPSRGRP